MKKSKVNSVVEVEVANALINNPDCTAKELKKAVEKALRKRGKSYNYKFTERTYLNLRNRLLPNAGPTGLDNPWSIGATAEYRQYFRPESIPILIQVQGRFNDEYATEEAKVFTIRHAMWIVQLEPWLASILSDEDEEDRDNIILAVAGMYARSQRVSALIGEKQFDTSELDMEFSRCREPYEFDKVGGKNTLQNMLKEQRLKEKKHERTH